MFVYCEVRTLTNLFSWQILVSLHSLHFTPCGFSQITIHTYKSKIVCVAFAEFQQWFGLGAQYCMITSPSFGTWRRTFKPVRILKYSNTIHGYYTTSWTTYTNYMYCLWYRCLRSCCKEAEGKACVRPGGAWSFHKPWNRFWTY